MKKRYILLLLFCLVLVGASAQTLEQAKAFYKRGSTRKPNPFSKNSSGHNRQTEIIIYGTVYAAWKQENLT